MTKELAWDIAETAHTLRRFYQRRANDFGVTRSQWRVLLWLGKEPGLKQVELAERMDIEPITLSRIVDRMEENGLVERQRDPGDRRAWRLALTDKAAPLLERLRDLAGDMATIAFDGLDEDALRVMQDILARVRTNVEAAETAAVEETRASA